MVMASSTTTTTTSNSSSGSSSSRRRRRTCLIAAISYCLMLMTITNVVPSECTTYDLSLILPSTYSHFVAAANAVNITPYTLPPIFTLFAPINSAFEVSISKL